MKESFEKQISFPTINSSEMEIILEYIYTESVKKKSLTKDNTVGAFYAADYFYLSDLQDLITEIVKYNISIKNYRKNYLPVLLSKAVEIMPLSKDKNKPIINHQKVAKELEPLVELIDFRRIERDQIDLIEPLKIIPAEIFQYDNSKLKNSDLNNIRGIPIYRIKESELFWDETGCGTNLTIVNNGKIVQALSNCSKHQSVRAKIALENKGIFEWDVIIEKTCSYAWVGVCASENFDYKIFAGDQHTGWVLGSSGECVISKIKYCSSFYEDGAKITVHLDMNRRTCAFTVNGIKCCEVLSWNNLPSKLYPVVSLNYPGRFRIQSHQEY
ncbi:hypothetical protein GLOIN_2v1788445 [Rhizophagus clarus]|uniref:B30.2/SPRY domain-containing protein n=1 Tax=Rhizophagus clarus TaxID=94130 RepID=A0A8H3QZ58_9GLOM|nr:hypothetical protein GLOIN_2v1788445 [Rhizophagus clarus]